MHLDEVFVKINGETHYLWRAVDHEGEVLESYVTRTRDKQAAFRFMKKALTLGMSYRLTERQSLNICFDVGTTKDAPDIGIVVRMPLTSS